MHQEPDGVGSHICTKVFGCWIERAGRAWVRSGKVLQRPSSLGGKPKSLQRLSVSSII